MLITSHGKGRKNCSNPLFCSELGLFNMVLSENQFLQGLQGPETHVFFSRFIDEILLYSVLDRAFHCLLKSLFGCFQHTILTRIIHKIKDAFDFLPLLIYTYIHFIF